MYVLQLKVPSAENRGRTLNFHKLLLYHCKMELQSVEELMEKRHVESEASAGVRTHGMFMCVCVCVVMSLYRSCFYSSTLLLDSFTIYVFLWVHFFIHSYRGFNVLISFLLFVVDHAFSHLDIISCLVGPTKASEGGTRENSGGDQTTVIWHCQIHG